MSWLDPLLAIKTQQAGTTAGTRQTINFASGATVTDDPANDRVNVAISATPADASTSAKGIVQLAGDIAGTATSVTVAKVNGVSVSGTPASGQVIRATSGTASAWANVARGDITNTSGATGDIITGNATTLTRLGIGSTGQVLTVSGGAPVWQQPGWYTAYEIDLTAQGSASYTANGSYTIGGQTYVLSGYAASSTIDLSSANGLRLRTAANTTNEPNWRLPSPVTLGASSDGLLIWLRTEVALSTSGGSLSYGARYITTSRVGATWSYYGGHYWQPSGSAGAPAGQFHATTGNFGGTLVPASPNDFGNYTTSNLSHDVWVYRILSPERMDVWSGTWSGGWPAFSSLQYRNYNALASGFIPGAATLSAFNPNEIAVSFSVFSGSGSSSTTTQQLKGFRIQTL